MHDTSSLDSFAALLVLFDGAISLAAFIALTMFMSFGAMSQKSNTVGLLIAFILVIVTAVAGVFSLLAGSSSGPPPYTGDYIAAGFAVAIAVLAPVGILVFTLILAIPAIIGRSNPTTSWPHQVEAMFQPHDRASASTGLIAWMSGLGVAGVFLAVVAFINLTTDPQSKDLTRDMNMSNVSKKAAPAPAPTPAPAPDTK